MDSPYVIQRSGADCMPVIPYRVFSVKYVPTINRFISIGDRGNAVVYSFSPDLVSWSEPKVLMEARVKTRWRPGKDPPRSYFSLLDSDSSSVNFDTLEGNPYLYFVQWRIEDGSIDNQKRDVYRVPIRIQ